MNDYQKKLDDFYKEHYRAPLQREFRELLGGRPYDIEKCGNYSNFLKQYGYEAPQSTTVYQVIDDETKEVVFIGLARDVAKQFEIESYSVQNYYQKKVRLYGFYRIIKLGETYQDSVKS